MAYAAELEIVERSKDINGSGVRIIEPVEGAPIDQLPLLFVNGLGANETHLGLFPDRLAVLGRTVVALDAVRDGDNGSMRNHARNVIDVADELGIDRFDVGGLSWGSLTAQVTALLDPDRVNKLVAVSTAPGAPVVPPSYRALKAIETATRNMVNAGDLFGGEIGQLIKRNVEDLSDSERANVLAIEAFMGRDIDESKLLLQKRSAMNLALAGPLHMLGLMGLTETPTLIIVGDEDELTRPKNAHVMGRLMSNAIVHTEHGVGHDVFFSRQEEIVPIIHDFLNAPTEPIHPATAFMGAIATSFYNIATLFVPQVF